MNPVCVRSVQTNINILPPVHLVIPLMPNSEHCASRDKKKKYYIDLVLLTMKLHSSLSVAANQQTGASSRQWLTAVFDDAVYHDPGLIAS